MPVKVLEGADITALTVHGNLAKGFANLDDAIIAMAITRVSQRGWCDIQQRSSHLLRAWGRRSKCYIMLRVTEKHDFMSHVIMLLRPSQHVASHGEMVSHCPGILCIDS